MDCGRLAGFGLLSAIIRVARAVTPGGDAVFPMWQGMEYLRDMASGRGKLDPLDNDRYGTRYWTSARDVLDPQHRTNGLDSVEREGGTSRHERQDKNSSRHKRDDYRL